MCLALAAVGMVVAAAWSAGEGKLSLAWGTDVVAGGRGGGDRRGEALGVAGGREMWRAAAAAGGEAEREREDRKECEKP